MKCRIHKAPQAQAAGSIQLGIGPIGISLRWDGSCPTGWPHKFYREFLAEGEPDLSLQVHCGDLPSCRLDELLFEAQDNRWNLYRSNGGYGFETFDTRTGEVNRLALMNRDLTRGTVYVRPEEPLPRVRSSGRPRGVPGWSLPLFMRQLGELLLVNLLSRNRGLLVHALAVNHGGNGLLFVGPSGSGKTTLASLYRGRAGVTILGDERIILTEADGGFFLSGTPWPGGGMTVSAETVPLRHVFFLEHSKTNVLHAESPARLAGLLFQQLFLPFWDRQGLTFVLRCLDRLFQTVPGHRLGFVNDERVIAFLQKHTGTSKAPRPLTAGRPRSESWRNVR